MLLVIIPTSIVRDSAMGFLVQSAVAGRASGTGAFCHNWGLGFRVIRVKGLGFRVWGVGFSVYRNCIGFGSKSLSESFERKFFLLELCFSFGSGGAGAGRGGGRGRGRGRRGAGGQGRKAAQVKVN